MSVPNVNELFKSYIAAKMQFAEAGVADILRSSQRDENFVTEIQSQIQSVVKLFGTRNYHSVQRIIPPLTNAWYYLMTTFGNLQTLGEEYTGTIRLNPENHIPSKTAELVWLSLYIGGEPLLDRLIHSLQTKIKNNTELTDQARGVLLYLLNFVQQHKQTLKRIHHSLFYINGKYYNISNRATGIKYALVRQWLQDDTFTQSFKILGQLSLFYVLFNFVQQVWSSKSNGEVAENVLSGAELSWKGCVLCAENRKNACATSCGHVFCWDCIYDSLKYQQNCPICREVVLPNRIIFLQNYV